MAYVESDIRATAARVRCPALVLHGSDDRDVPLALGQQLAETIPGATLQVLEGQGHRLVHGTTPGRTATLDWIAALEAAR